MGKPLVSRARAAGGRAIRAYGLPRRRSSQVVAVVLAALVQVAWGHGLVGSKVHGLEHYRPPAADKEGRKWPSGLDIWPQNRYKSSLA